MRTLFRIIILVYASSQLLRAQIPPSLDSLVISTNKMKPDSMKVKKLIAVSLEFILIGQLDTSIYYSTAALDLADKIKFEKGSALALIKIAQANTYKANYPVALDHYLKALRIAVKIKNKRIESDCYGNLGVIYDTQKEFDKAIKYYKMSSVIKTELGDKRSLGMILANMAILMRQHEQFDSALYYHFRSLELKQSIDDPRDLGIAQGNIGRIFLDKKQFEKGDSILTIAVSNLRKVGDDRGLAIVLIASAEAKDDLGRTNEAIKLAMEGYQIATKLKVYEQLEASTGMLAEFYGKTGQFDKAYRFSIESRKAQDSIFNIEKNNSIVSKQMSYDFEKKQLADSLKQEIKVQSEKKESEAKLSRQRMIAWFGIVGFILALAIVYILFRTNKEKQRTNVQLTEKNSLIESQKREVELQKHIVEEKNHEILDSINYAKRIQDSLLANEQMLEQYLPTHFVFFKPKDIVSGDFYWAAKEGDRFFLAICDSTGHGVPGAFMSLLNIGFLSEAIKEKQITSPEKVFNYVRKRLIESISGDGQRDGFDGILVCFDLKEKVITYAAANNSPLLMDNGNPVHLAMDKMPVGMGEKQQDFSLFTVQHKPNSMIYFYTDGYADQFGGPNGKKFMYKKLNDLLFSNTSLPLPEQKEMLGVTFDGWKGQLEQVDDVCVIGILL
jgi:serine phosphatase RsbU (regulator of sigma subunit)